MAMAKGTSSPDFAAIWLGAVSVTSIFSGPAASGSGGSYLLTSINWS